MVIKINIADKAKTWKVESDGAYLMGKNVGDKIHGAELKSELEGYELEIMGGSDSAGFPLSKDVEGVYLRKVLLTEGFGMRQSKPHGLRKRKTLRGKVISEAVVQLNLVVVKHGGKKLHEIFPEQNQPKATKTGEQKAPAPAA
ncbi:MAG: S6e family ribosomal protein [Nanoarchaeota archaeon]